MNIFKFEVKRLFVSMIIWSLSLSAALILFMSFFPLFGGENEDMLNLLDQYPEELLAFFGMNSELPFTTLMGYFSLTYGFIMVPISVQAANYGFHILSVEERELTADFLLTKPVKRQTLYIAKVAASIVTILMTNIIVFAISIASLYLFNNGETVDVINTIRFLLSIILLQLFFFSTGLLISVLVKKIGSVIAYSMSLGFGFYIISSLGTMISSDILKILSPFTHFDSSYVYINSHLQYNRIWISVLIMIGSFIASYMLYLKRDIKSL